MVINGIEYVVALYITGHDGFPDYVAHFEDFNGLNGFIRENTDNKHYLEAQMCYSLVELIDGELEPFSWTVNIEWKELSAEQVQEEIDNFIEFEKGMAEESEKIDIKIILEQLLVYFIFTYFCGAVYDDNVIGKVKMSVDSVYIIYEMIAAMWMEQGQMISQKDIERIVYRYSRELEHSDLNLEIMEELQ